MDDQQALAIVSALANGANPVSGEFFAADSPYQAPKVIRALFAAQRALEARLDRPVKRPDERLVERPADRPAERSSSTPEKRASAPVPASRTSVSANAGKPWSSDEDKQLLAEFDAEISLVEIARAHGRTVNGVRARLEKHGRLEASAATRWPKADQQEGGRRAGRGSVQQSKQAGRGPLSAG